jgi:hypothetical protein
LIQGVNVVSRFSGSRIPRIPGNKHWEACLLPQMEPEEFLKYWDVSYSKLAEICHCSLPTVKRWFSVSSRQLPTSLHKICLAATHKAWISVK